MAYVRLLQDHDGDKAGTVVYRPATVARQLVARGKAVDGTAVRYKPDRERAVSSNYETRGLPDDFPEKDRLEDAGYDSIAKIKTASDQDILDIKYIGASKLDDIREAAGDI